MRFYNFTSSTKPLSHKAARRLRAFWKDRKATSAIELALILPLVAGMIVPLTDLGMAAYTKMQVQNAAQAGADYALKNATTTFDSTYISNISNAVTSATSLSGVQVDPTPTESCHCVDASGVASPSFDDTTETPPCTTVCDSGTAGIFITVGARASYAPLFPYPMISSPVTFTATSVVRVQ